MAGLEEFVDLFLGSLFLMFFFMQPRSKFKMFLSEDMRVFCHVFSYLLKSFYFCGSKSISLFFM